MGALFQNQSFISEVLKHRSLPVYKTYEFDFFRCVSFNENLYGKTISELHSGNLRNNDNRGRYSKLFPDEKISYWADSKATAVAEIKRHNSNNNYLTFWSYDDASSTFPILNADDHLVIIDGRDLNFHSILLKIEKCEELTRNEKALIELISYEKPDCLAYKSVVKENGLNFLFFEKGFKKLALREVKLYLGELKSKNAKSIPCATTSDYSPSLKSYGMYFEPIVKSKYDKEYINTEEYKFREKNYSNSIRRISNFHKSNGI